MYVVYGIYRAKWGDKIAGERVVNQAHEHEGHTIIVMILSSPIIDHSSPWVGAVSPITECGGGLQDLAASKILVHHLTTCPHIG